ncbi:hypothetical protein ACFPES_33385 [Paenibacillus sp. GCM10023248]|nr:hypothetical protein [Paenibacillus sp. MAHUQ-63]MDD9271931.1 hypothetical protein [Paenibacillus sp. MAHUQ-63]
MQINEDVIQGAQEITEAAVSMKEVAVQVGQYEGTIQLKLTTMQRVR